MSIDDENEVVKKKSTAKVDKKQKERETYIHETEDTIVDFADPDAFSKITSKNRFNFLKNNFTN
jgi:hypothetical protein